MDFPRTQKISSKLDYSADSSTIEVSLIGERIEDEVLESLSKKLAFFNLKNTYLKVKQSGDTGTDMNLLRSDILKDLYERNELLIQDKDQKIALLERELAEYGQTTSQVNDIAAEAKINHPNLQSFSINRTIMANLQANRQDTLFIAFARFGKNPNQQERRRFENWLKIRTKADSLALIIN